jgi:hypothetical protein
LPCYSSAISVCEHYGELPMPGVDFYRPRSGLPV